MTIKTKIIKALFVLLAIFFLYLTGYLIQVLSVNDPVKEGTLWWIFPSAVLSFAGVPVSLLCAYYYKQK